MRIITFVTKSGLVLQEKTDPVFVPYDYLNSFTSDFLTMSFSPVIVST